MPLVSFASPFGTMTLIEQDGALVALSWGGTAQQSSTPLLAEAQAELNRYFAGEPVVFDLPLRPAGSAFRQRVWQAMRQIPRGSIASYGELAERLGSSPRAVGGACGANPLPILIPCHRVLARGGRAGGYSGGGGLATKFALLRLEGAVL